MRRARIRIKKSLALALFVNAVVGAGPVLAGGSQEGATARTVTVDVDRGGKVIDSHDQIDCFQGIGGRGTPDCQGSYTVICDESGCVGETVTFSASAFEGFAFGAWAGACTGTLPTCSLEVTDNLSVSATFVDVEDPLVSFIGIAPGDTMTQTEILEAQASDNVSVAEVSFAFQLPGAASPESIGSDPTAPYSQEWDVSDLPEGNVTLTVTATDAAGNSGSDSVAVTINHEAQRVLITSGPSDTFRLSGKARFDFTSSSDDVSFFYCVLDDDLGDTCDPPAVFSGLAEGDHTFAVGAVDESGDSLESAQSSWNVPYDNESLRHRGAWNRKSAVGHYKGTVSITRSKGASLRIASPAKSVALIATKCPGCGTVKVMAGSEFLKRVKLGADTVSKKRVILVRNSADTISGPIKVVVVSEGKKVMIDGLGVSRLF